MKLGTVNSIKKLFLSNINLFFIFRFFIRIRLLRINHPVIFSLILVFISLILSIFLGKLINIWIFYLLVLIFLGGVIVVILFLVSICSNEKFFKISFKINFFILIFLLFNCFLSIINEINFNIIIKLYIIENVIRFIIFCLILLVCLISVVIIRKLEYGPLVKRLYYNSLR